MAYEKIQDRRTIQLGGINKKTGKANPTELEGYYLGFDTVPNKFNPEKPQKRYKFQTKEGDTDIYGKAGIDRALKNAKIGLMTKLWPTGETLDTGKGNPMKVYDAEQDRNNTIDVDSISSSAYEGDDEDSESAMDEVVPPTATAPKVAASVPSASRLSDIQSKLKTRANRL